MSVREEEASAAVHHHDIVGHHGKLEEHLVDIRVAVSPHGHDVAAHCVEPFDDGRGIDVVGYAVARTVIDYVAEQEQHVTVLVSVKVEGAFEPAY